MAQAAALMETAQMDCRSVVQVIVAGLVVGFAVRDLQTAIDELKKAGLELLGEPGPAWRHFRGPDGNVYELVADLAGPAKPQRAAANMMIGRWPLAVTHASPAN